MMSFHPMTLDFQWKKRDCVFLVSIFRCTNCVWVAYHSHRTGKCLINYFIGELLWFSVELWVLRIHNEFLAWRLILIRVKKLNLTSSSLNMSQTVKGCWVLSSHRWPLGWTWRALMTATPLWLNRASGQLWNDCFPSDQSHLNSKHGWWFSEVVSSSPAERVFPRASP